MIKFNELLTIILNLKKQKKNLISNFKNLSLFLPAYVEYEERNIRISRHFYFGRFCYENFPNVFYCDLPSRNHDYSLEGQSKLVHTYLLSTKR